ncbi:MAG: hypothetical protein Q7K35_00490 [bacterium]|nr:hypothetical protein [bacterium]
MVKKYRIAIIIFVVSLVLRLVFAFLLYGSVNFNTDNFLNSTHSDGYYEIAYNLIHHKIFSMDSAPPIISDSVRTPGYPLIIAASFYIFDSLWPLLIIQIIIGSILPLLGRVISWEIMPNNKIANLVGWLLAVEPVGIMLSTWMISETFFTLFFFWFVLFIIKFIKAAQAENTLTLNNYQTIGWAALLLGIATLIRPTALYLPVILIPAWYGYRFFLKNQYMHKQIIIFLVIFTLTLSPWFYRNYKTFDVVSITSSKEDVMFTALAPSVLAIKNHQGYSESQIDFFKSKGFERYPMVNLDKAAWFQRQAIEVLKDNPKEFIMIAGISLLTFFTHDGMLTFLSFLGLIKSSGLTVGQVLAQPLPEMFDTLKELFFSPALSIMFMRGMWFLATLLFLMNIVRAFIKRRFTVLSALALILVAYFALTTISNGFGVNARFRFSVNVFIFMFAVEFLFVIIDYFKFKFLKTPLKVS